MFTKEFFIREAFASIGLADYVYDLSPEQLQRGLTVVDSMMATWDSQGMRVGWSIPNAANESALDDEVNVPYYSREAIFLVCGKRLASYFGKTLSLEARENASEALNALMNQMAQPIPMQFPDTLPSGAGNKSWRNLNSPFLGPPVDPVQSGTDGYIDFGTLPSETS